MILFRISALDLDVIHNNQVTDAVLAKCCSKPIANMDVKLLLVFDEDNISFSDMVSFISG